MTSLRIWDLPTRVFHWLFALSFTAAWSLGEAEGWLGWHSYFGYLVGGLVLFRLVWGFVGEEHSRFRSFPLDPGSAWRYLMGLRAGSTARHLGHNPAGAIAIYALLALGLVTACSGMALLGADKALGPLAGMVSPSWEDAIKEVHEFSANAMLLVVLAHIAGVVLGSLRHRENLPLAMVTGYRSTAPESGSTAPARPRAGVALALLLGIAAFTVSHDFTAGCGDNPAACESAATDDDDDD